MDSPTISDLARAAMEQAENRLAWGQLGDNPHGYRKSLAEIALSFARDHGYHEIDGAFSELHSLRDACAREPLLAAEVLRTRDVFNAAMALSSKLLEIGLPIYSDVYTLELIALWDACRSAAPLAPEQGETK